MSNSVRADDGLLAAHAPVVLHMSRPIVMESVLCTPGMALRAMLESGQRHVAVVDHRGTFLGAVSAATVAASRGPTLDGLAGCLVLHLSPASSMSEAASLMLTYGVDVLGVLDPNGEVVGILNWSDILEMVPDRERP